MKIGIIQVSSQKEKNSILEACVKEVVPEGYEVINFGVFEESEESIRALFAEPLGNGYPPKDVERKKKDTEELKAIKPYYKNIENTCENKIRLIQ